MGQSCGECATSRIAPDTVVRNSVDAIGLLARYHRIASRKSSLASGWNRNDLLSIRELFGKFLEHLLAGDCLHASGADVVDAALDLFVPCSFDALFGRFVVEACNQAVD